MGFRWLLDAPTPILYLMLYVARGDAQIFSTYKAFLELFPDVNIEGYFFHLCKRSNFKVKQLGLTNKYRSDADFKIRIKKLAALGVNCNLQYPKPNNECLPATTKNKSIHIQQTQIFTVDILSVNWLLLTFYFLIRI